MSRGLESAAMLTRDVFSIQFSTLQILCRLRAQMDRRSPRGGRLPRASGRLGLADLKDGQLPKFSGPCFPRDGIFGAEADQRGPDGGENGYSLPAKCPHRPGRRASRSGPFPSCRHGTRLRYPCTRVCSERPSARTCARSSSSVRTDTRSGILVAAARASLRNSS